MIPGLAALSAGGGVSGSSSAHSNAGLSQGGIHFYAAPNSNSVAPWVLGAVVIAAVFLLKK